MSGATITGLVRFSYAAVFKPTAMNEGDTPKYSISLLIPKKDKKSLAKIKKAIKACMEDNKDSVFGGKIKGLKNPLRDGDEEREDQEAYENMFFLNASSTRKPQILDRDMDPITEEEDFYSGCYGRASLNFFAYNRNGNKGIGVGLNNLQKIKDGERLGGGATSAFDDFDDDFADQFDDFDDGDDDDDMF